MSIVVSFLALVVGLAILIVGADLLVRGAAQLAKVMGLSAFAIGVTVVAFGTSAPELFASIGAALQGVPDLAVGNVLGSNIANILLILGVGAMLAVIPVLKRVRFTELPVMLAITAASVVMMLDHAITRIEGALLTCGLVAYVIFIIKSHRVDIESEGDDLASGPKSIKTDLLMIVGGIVGLGLGAKALVYGASDLAIAVGVPAGVVGTTVVAFGTSLPELAATVRAAATKESEMAVGNIVGSNVFNLLSVLGITAMIKPLSMPESMDLHIWSMLGISVLFVLIVILYPRLTRLSGVFFVLVYVCYVVISYTKPDILV